MITGRLSGIVSLVLTLLFTAGCLSTGAHARFKQPDFSYEYPRGWTRHVERYSDFVATSVWDPKTSDNESPVKVDVNVRLGLGTKAEEEARGVLLQRIKADSGERNFALIKQENITLDGNAGYFAEYIHDAVSSYKVVPENRFYIPTRVIDISAARNGRVYQIWISASQNEWNAHEQDIQHVLDTFRWR